MAMALVMKYIHCGSIFVKELNAVLILQFITRNSHLTVYITNKTECFSLNSGHVIRVAKVIKRLAYLVLQKEFQPFRKFYY